MLFDAENLLLLAAKESGLEDFGGGAFDHDYRKFFASLNASELLRSEIRIPPGVPLFSSGWAIRYW